MNATEAKKLSDSVNSTFDEDHFKRISNILAQSIKKRASQGFYTTREEIEGPFNKMIIDRVKNNLLYSGYAISIPADCNLKQVTRMTFQIDWNWN